MAICQHNFLPLPSINCKINQTISINYFLTTHTKCLRFFIFSDLEFESIVKRWTSKKSHKCVSEFISANRTAKCTRGKNSKGASYLFYTLLLLFHFRHILTILASIRCFWWSSGDFGRCYSQLPNVCFQLLSTSIFAFFIPPQLSSVRVPEKPLHIVLKLSL